LETERQIKLRKGVARIENSGSFISSRHD